MVGNVSVSDFRVCFVVFVSEEWWKWCREVFVFRFVYLVFNCLRKWPDVES